MTGGGVTTSLRDLNISTLTETPPGFHHHHSASMPSPRLLNIYNFLDLLWRWQGDFSQHSSHSIWEKSWRCQVSLCVYLQKCEDQATTEVILILRATVITQQIYRAVIRQHHPKTNKSVSKKHKLCPKSGWSFLSGHIPRYLHHLEKLKQMGSEWKHSQLMRVSLRHTRADQTSSGSCHRTIVSIIMPGLPGVSPSSDLALCHITALLWIPVKNHAPSPPALISTEVCPMGGQPPRCAGE